MAAVTELTERQKALLAVVVRVNLATAQPVGSQQVKEAGRFPWSSATLRNEMKYLEEQGYLEQPHTSAGRVPTAKGYRAYVDYCVKENSLSPSAQRKLEARLNQVLEPTEFVRQASAMLAEILSLPACATPPSPSLTQLDHMELSTLGRKRLLVLLVTSTGEVLHRVVETPANLSEAKLAGLNLILNRRLAGRRLAEVAKLRPVELLPGELAADATALKVARTVLEAVAAATSGPDSVIVEGTLHLFEQPEFRDVDLMRQVLSVLENDAVLAQLLKRHLEAGMRVRVAIGEEIGLEAMRRCSLVSAVYHAGGVPVGVVTLLGPMRMSYGYAIAAARFAADRLTRRLTEQVG